jgi:hypothetical protein
VSAGVEPLVQRDWQVIWQVNARLSLRHWLPCSKDDLSSGTFVGMKVWLDDVRPAPAGWVHVLTPEAAIDLLRSDDVEEISLDHDLGLFTEGGKERTGYEVLVFIEREVAMGTATFTVPEIHIHSANAVGRRRMTQAIQSIKRYSPDRRVSP